MTKGLRTNIFCTKATSKMQILAPVGVLNYSIQSSFKVMADL